MSSIGSRRPRVLLALAAMAPTALLAVPALSGESSALADVEAGRKIYDQGLLSSGVPLRARRAGGTTGAGRAVACVNCHRRSGFGMYEGGSLIPPVTGPALFRNDHSRQTFLRRSTPGSPHKAAPHLTRPVYDEASLARAIRSGVAPSGHVFKALMPRYELGDDDMANLAAYLRQLSDGPPPGLDGKRAVFATVIAPGQSRERRDAVVRTLSACLGERFSDPAPEGASPPLAVWDLDGPSATWRAQLEAKAREAPVLAFLSGLGGAEWHPVHEFCERERIPCLFPNVDVPGNGLKEDVYSFYFSGGVLLEARVAGRFIREETSRLGLRRVVVVTGRSETSQRAAGELRQALGDSLMIDERRLARPDDAGIAEVLGGLGKSDALVLWLDRDEVTALDTHQTPDAGAIVVSGWLAGLERAPLPAAWKARTLMLYPLDAPERREVRMSFNLRPFLNKHGLAGADEILAGNTLAACNIAAESLYRMQGYTYRDHLIDEVESYPVAMGNAPAPQAYPRFNIGIGQRFSSRGAYIARFTGEGNRMEKVRDWLTP